MGWSSWTEGVLIIWSAAATRCSVPKSSQQAICRRNGMAKRRTCCRLRVCLCTCGRAIEMHSLVAPVVSSSSSRRTVAEPNAT